MLPTTQILTIFRSRLLSVMKDLHKPEFPHVCAPTSKMSELGSSFTITNYPFFMNTMSKSQPRRKKKTQNLSYRHMTFWVPGAQERCIRRPNLGAQHAKNRQRMPMVMYDPGTRRLCAHLRRFAPLCAPELT